MQFKKIVASIVACLMVFSLLGVLNSEQANASTTQTAFVNVSSGTLNVRTGPGTSYKVVGTLQNNTKVTVHAQTKNGWSEIRYKEKKAYVATRYLRFYSYLMDVTKRYTYTSEGRSYDSVYERKYNKVWDQWVSGEEAYLVREDNKGLYIGYPESEYFRELVYPVRVGARWTDFETTRRIVSMDKKLTTKAGTFRGVVTVRTSDGFTMYYAKNVGLIKAVYEGETISELTRLTKR